MLAESSPPILYAVTPTGSLVRTFFKSLAPFRFGLSTQPWIATRIVIPTN